MNWKQLIEERDEWVAKNFPDHKLDSPPDESIVGVIEEVGELAHCHLKAAQGIRGTVEEHERNAQDAIGDITIYLLGVMSHLAYIPDDAARRSPSCSTPTWALKYLAYHVGQLALSGSGHSCERIIEYLEAYCDFQDWGLEYIVTRTWDRVKERDWQKNRIDGGENENTQGKEEQTGGSARFNPREEGWI